MNAFKIYSKGNTYYSLGGLRPPLEKQPALKLSKLLIDNLPSPPEEFDVDPTRQIPVSMCGNDQFGDCYVIATLRNIQHQAYALTGKILPDDKNAVLDIYKTLSPDDTGCYPDIAARWFKNNGFRFSTGEIFTFSDFGSFVTGYECDTLEEIRIAIYYLKSCILGLNWPSSAMQQFEAKQVLTPVENSASDGGHAVHIKNYRADGTFGMYTWGELIYADSAFINKYLMIAQGFIPKDIVGTVIDPDKLEFETRALKKIMS